MTTTWTVDECAAAWGIKPSTWRYYVSTGYAPRPLPGYDPHTGRRLWDAEQVRTYQRPGQGRKRSS